LVSDLAPLDDWGSEFPEWQVENNNDTSFLDNGGDREHDEVGSVAASEAENGGSIESDYFEDDDEHDEEADEEEDENDVFENDKKEEEEDSSEDDDQQRYCMKAKKVTAKMPSFPEGTALSSVNRQHASAATTSSIVNRPHASAYQQRPRVWR